MPTTSCCWDSCSTNGRPIVPVEPTTATRTSAGLVCDTRQEPPADQIMERLFELPERPSEKRSETFYLDRSLFAVGSPGNCPARPASDQSAQDGSSAADQRTEAHDDRPNADKANRVSRETHEAERHSPNLVPVKLLQPQRIQQRFHLRTLSCIDRPILMLDAVAVHALGTIQSRREMPPGSYQKRPPGRSPEAARGHVPRSQGRGPMPTS
jgi:hypothetical protein